MGKEESIFETNEPADILEIAYQSAINRLEKSFVWAAGLTDEVEYVCRCSNLAGVRFLLACLVAKLSNPELDIRKPYTEIGGAGVYSGRHYDETYIAPFVFKYGLPVNPTTSFLTPAFRTNKSVIDSGVELVGRPKKLYETVVAIITAVHEGKANPELLLIEIVRWLAIVKFEREDRLESLFASLAAAKLEAALPAESIVNLIQQHISLPKSSRLPALVVAAAYQAAQNLLGEMALPLESHTAADSQTGALGDVQIVLKDDANIVTVYEMKAKRTTPEDIEIAVQKLAIAGRRIDNYIFITTEKVADEVNDLAASMHAKTGAEFVILDCIGFLRHFLHFFYRSRMRFLDAYQELVLGEANSAVNPTLKEAFLSLRLATETGLAQTSEDI
jgi:DNA adenine methylase